MTTEEKQAFEKLEERVNQLEIGAGVLKELAKRYVRIDIDQLIANKVRENK
jgi:hypothetical protein